MRVADFFCGGGGFSEGFRQAGFEIVFAVDKWAPAVNTYKGNKPGANVIQDDVIRISNLPDDEFEALVPDSEVIIGSPPCQSFSHSNKSGNADKELGIKLIEARWLTDLEHGCGYQSKYAPKVWKEWVDKGKYTPLITEKNPIQYRKANEQLPTGGTLEFSMLEHIISFFVDPYTFEQFACKLVQIMDSNIVSIEQTRRTRDGGRDAVGQYRVGLATGGVELEFALEAKRYSLNNSVGVKETSRLISRIKHRQFGIFVTTSFVGDQAYKEIIEDQHPIVVISGKDIVDILISAGINSVDILNDWLESNFGLH